MVVAACLLALLAVLYWRKPLSDAVALAQTTSPRIGTSRPVQTAVARPLSNAAIHEFPGKVRACRRAELAFSVSGLLEEVNAAEGCRFREGERLARLDQRDFQYELALAKARYVAAEKAFRRANSLRNARAISERDCDEAESLFRVAEASVQMREKALQDSELRAPFDGVVATRYIENHEHIQAKQPILSFQDIATIEIVIQVPERFVTHGGPQSLHALAVRFGVDGDRWREVTIREYRMQSDAVCRTYDVVLALPRPADIAILPGMTATVRGSVPQDKEDQKRRPSCVIVPVEAIVNDGGKTFVWVIAEAGGIPRKTLVDLGALRGDGVEVHAGLQPGQHVAIAGLHALSEDSPVRPQSQDAEGLDL